MPQGLFCLLSLLKEQHKVNLYGKLRQKASINLAFNYLFHRCRWPIQLGSGLALAFNNRQDERFSACLPEKLSSQLLVTFLLLTVISVDLLWWLLIKGERAISLDIKKTNNQK